MSRDPKDIPALFSAPMILALLAGQKTQTRRPLYVRRTSKTDAIPNHIAALAGYPPPTSLLAIGDYWTVSGWEKVRPKDRLWVRESLHRPEQLWRYMADGEQVIVPSKIRQEVSQWSDARRQDSAPSIHMPKWASRLTLIVENVKIERLQAISRADAIAEGIVEIEGAGPYIRSLKGYGSPGLPPQLTARAPELAYLDLWARINGTDEYMLNPWVVATTFRVIKANIGSDPR